MTLETPTIHQSPAMSAYCHIVVGIDFSPASHSAMLTAARLFASAQTLTIVHVIEPRTAAELKRDNGVDEDGMVQNTRTSVQRLAEEAGIDVTSANIDIYIGHPFTCLNAACLEHGADLLVLGSRGSEHCRNYIGAMASKCVRNASADVLLIREQQHRGFRKPLVCVDFSENSLNAVSRAGHMAQCEHSPLDCLHVFQSGMTISLAHFVSPAALEQGNESIESLNHSLDIFVRPVLSFYDHLKWTAHIRESRNVRDGIIEYVHENRNDLVVLGNHGVSNLRNLLIGSIAESVINHATCSILAVKSWTRNHNKQAG